MVATVVTGTGIAMDDIVASEISGAATMEIVMDQHAAGARVFPAVDIARSGTRKEDLILGKDEVGALGVVRQKLAAHSTLEGLQAVVKTLGTSSSNADALVSLQKNLGN